MFFVSYKTFRCYVMYASVNPRLIVSSTFLLKDLVRPSTKVRKKLSSLHGFFERPVNQPVMAQRGSDNHAPGTSSGTDYNVLPVVNSCLSRSSKKRRQQKQRRREESISNLVVNPANCQYQFASYPKVNPAGLHVNYYGHNQYATLLQPYQFNNVTYSNYFNAVLQPNLHQAYFHSQSKPQQQRSSQRGGNANNKFMDGLRYWEKLTTTVKKPGFNFSIMSYNVLAQDLVRLHPHLYSLHCQEALNWELRWKNVFAEIKKFSPEILCLQEVQGSHLEKYYSQLRVLGYEGVYKQRTGVRTDGCAIYYKTDVLDMIEHVTVEFNQPNVAILDRDNVGIIARFAPKTNSKSEFVAATTHLLYNPKRHDVRLAQVQVLLAEIDRLAFKPTSDSRKPYLPVLLTGDLNSKPKTAVYQLITDGYLDYENLTSRSMQNVPAGGKIGKTLVPSSLKITDQCQHAALIPKRETQETIPRSEEVKLIELKHSEREFTDRKKEKTATHDPNLFSSGTLSHKFHLKSVYTHGHNGNTEGTTYQDEWISVDYIFYSKEAGQRSDLTLMERYKLPTKKDLGNLKIPNMDEGSDHLPLIAKFHLEV